MDKDTSQIITSDKYNEYKEEFINNIYYVLNPDKRPKPDTFNPSTSFQSVKKEEITKIQNTIKSINKSLAEFDKDEASFKEAINQLREYTAKANKDLTEIKDKIQELEASKSKK